jgi:hypothetical protein
MELEVKRYQTKRGSIGLEIRTSYYDKKLEKSHIRSIWVPLGLVPTLKEALDRETRRMELTNPYPLSKPLYRK